MIEDFNVISSAANALVVVISPRNQPWWTDPHLWVAIGAALGTVLAAGIAAYAAHVSRASALASQESVGISERTADLLDKQFQEQMEQKKPLLNFGSLVFLNSPEPDITINPTNRIFYLNEFNIDVVNRREANISSLAYVWAIATIEEVFAINHAFVDLSYSHINKYNIKVKLSGRPCFNRENFYVFLFIYTFDDSCLTSFTKYGRHITENCFSSGIFILHPIENPDLSNLFNLNENIYTHVLKMEPEKRRMIGSILSYDPRFREYVKDWEKNNATSLNLFNTNQ